MLCLRKHSFCLSVHSLNLATWENAPTKGVLWKGRGPVWHCSDTVSGKSVVGMCICREVEDFPISLTLCRMCLCYLQLAIIVPRINLIGYGSATAQSCVLPSVVSISNFEDQCHSVPAMGQRCRSANYPPIRERGTPELVCGLLWSLGMFTMEVRYLK